MSLDSNQCEILHQSQQSDDWNWDKLEGLMERIILEEDETPAKKVTADNVQLLAE